MSYELSIIIPCYNEKDTILEILRLVRDVPISKEIIVVCDGSTDGTRDVLEKELIRNGSDDFRVIFHEHNKGKGASVRTGIDAACGDIVIIQDADLELNPADYVRLLEPMKNGAKVVFGTRFLGARRISIPFYSRFANWCVTTLANVLYGARISDEACGYKIMSLDLYRSLRLECDGFDICPEITAKVCRKKHRIYEVPVQFNPRSFREGKKVQWKHGFEAVWKLIKYRFIRL